MSLKFTGKDVLCSMVDTTTRKEEERIYIDLPKSEEDVKVLKVASGCQYQLEPSTVNERDIIFVSGPPRCGKTMFAMNFAKQYCKKYPERGCWLFTPNIEDETIMTHRPPGAKIVDCREMDMQEDLNKECFNNSLLFFDDTDYYEDVEISKSIEKFALSCVGIGRHKKQTIIISKHILLNYQKTRTLLQLSTHVVTFPNIGSSYMTEKFVKTYFPKAGGILKELDDKFSRFVVFRTFAPLALFTENWIVAL